MYSTFFTIALFTATAIHGAFAAFAINNPKLVQCGNARISWAPTENPGYNLIVVKASEPCGDSLVDVGDFTKTFVDWKVTLKAGTEVILSVVDSKDEEAWSDKIVVGPSNDSSCLPDAPAPATDAGVTPITPDVSSAASNGTPDIVGAANAGTNPFAPDSGALSARQASTPVAVVAGLVALFALL